MSELIGVNHVSPIERRSYTVDVAVNAEYKSDDGEDDENYNTMALLELATCVETNQEHMEFPSTDIVLDRKSGLMVCLLCLEEMESNLLTDHMVNAHSYRKVQLKCQICGMKFKERSLFMVHRKECRPREKRHKRKSYRQMMKELEALGAAGGACPVCTHALPCPHVRAARVLPELALTCATCRRSFKSRLTLRDHVRLVHDSVEETEECQQCGQRFRSQKYLSNHRRNVHPADNKSYTCAACGKSFKSRLCLHQHGKHVHPPPSAAARCSLCPHKLFKSRVNLQQHLRVSHAHYRRPD